ncbi:MAG: hypothetical protein HXX15_21160 [Rhodopseudomonas sp.]|uniref:hypothetical protein n=1 Tax=Rhodopseudomonas sp. TaxID=1078 RepID=UPI00185E6CDB|nr:hypothetical protein [Rhodopseudomonas sp.]NVN88596.1 hypothetical protein [Rhodopseudomonas sp.]
MTATPTKPLGRMTPRKSIMPNDGQPRRVRLWTLDAPPGSTAERLLKTYLGALDAVDAIDSAKARINADPELTDAGKAKQIKLVVLGETVPAIARGRIELAKARREVETRRTALVPPKADPADAAGAVRRQELRAFLRGLDDKARAAFLKSNSGDQEVTTAIIEQPAALSGIRDSLRDQMLNDAMQSKYADQIEAIQELEEAIEVAASAIDSGREEAHKEAAAADPALRDPDAFHAVASAIEARTPALWIKPHTENGAEVMRWLDWNEESQSGTWRLAEQEHLDRGIVAKTRDEFDQVSQNIAVLVTGETTAEARSKRAAFVDEHGAEAYFNRRSDAAA